MRVLWSFTAQQGCWYPAVGPVLALRARGHEVVALSRAPVAPAMAALGIPLVTDELTPWPDELGPLTGPPVSLDQALRRRAHVAGCHRDHVARLLARERIDAVLTDGFRLGAGFAAAGAGVPWASYVHHQFDDRASSEGIVQLWRDRFAPERPLRDVFVEWWPALRAALGVGREPRPEADATWWNQSPHATFVLGLPELLGHRQRAPAAIHHVGPSLWDGLPAAPPAWLAELGAGPPAVLVALSAGTLEDTGTLVAAARAARARGLDVAATLSLEREVPALPDGTRVAVAVSHGMLLPRVRAAVATGGLGTVTRLACAGLPAVLVPRVNDQFLVAEAAVAAGMAVRLLPAELDEVRLGAALDRVLTDERLAAAAARLRDASARYDAPAAIAGALEALA
ncbi:MAG TPA: nucleotide disphospho-sugar-binding domain-containing protein [Candidatus Dormibacteraeota bacterium]